VGVKGGFDAFEECLESLEGMVDDGKVRVGEQLLELDNQLR
jgi:hypothetical protein